ERRRRPGCRGWGGARSQQRRGAGDELDGEAPRVAEHDEAVAVSEGLQVVGDGGAGGDEFIARGDGIGDGEGEVELQRVERRVVEERRARVVVEFDDDAAGGVGEEVGVRRAVELAGDGEAEVPAIPGGDGDGIGNLPGGVFDGVVHREREASVWAWATSGEDAITPMIASAIWRPAV